MSVFQALIFKKRNKSRVQYCWIGFLGTVYTRVLAEVFWTNFNKKTVVGRRSFLWTKVKGLKASDKSKAKLQDTTISK